LGCCGGIFLCTKTSLSLYLPLSLHDYDVCAITVLDHNGDHVIRYLTEEEEDTFIDTLKNADIALFPSKDDLKFDGGAIRYFTIRLTKNFAQIPIGTLLYKDSDGNVLYSHLYINGHCYACDLETIEALEGFWCSSSTP
jgi:hypothetical protein